MMLIKAEIKDNIVSLEILRIGPQCWLRGKTYGFGSQIPEV